MFKDFFKIGVNFHTCSKHNYSGTLPCVDCREEVLIINFYNKMDKFLKNQKDIPKEYSDIVREKFWDII